MPRHPRVVFVDVPHHVTQRGNHREPVFFSPGDRETYLGLLKDHAARWGVRVVAYCLMPNHVHHVVIPSDPAGMHRVFKSVHGRYAQRVNRMRNVSGHLWQARYFSSPLDGQYFLNAVRYVELNPVRALMVERAHEYPWSSAAAHCGLRSDAVVDIHRLDPALAAIGDWGRWLEQGVSAEVLATIRRHGSQNLPCGSEQFVDELGVEVNRDLRFHCHGGPRTSK